MNEDVEYEEEEEYMTIYRKTKRTHGKAKHKQKTNAERNPKTTFDLSPFLHGVGAKPTLGKRRDFQEPCTKPSSVHQMVKKTLSELDSIATKGNSVSGTDTGERLFLGECDFEDDTVEDDDEIEEDDWVEKKERDSHEDKAGEKERTFSRKYVWRFEKTDRKGYDRFRRLVEFIMIAKQIFTIRPVRLNRRDSILFFMDTHKSSGTEEDAGAPLFDVTAFKSLGQKCMTSSMKSCLELPPQNRTESQVTQMVHTMRGFTKFAGYPQAVQTGICRRGWYARFQSTTVIVREGNRAEFFYIILSGEAVSNNSIRLPSIDTENTGSQWNSTKQLSAGDTIGEKEILTDKERPSTIVCRDPVEVLGVDRDILLDIFHAAGGQASIHFLRNVPELSPFPLELLQTSHFSMASHYYRRGAVIVNNSNDSEWIYVIRFGSCSVFKSVNESEKTGIEHHVATRRSIGREDAITLPSISRTKGLLKSASTEDLTDITQRKDKAKKMPTLERSHTTFPSINPGKTSLLANTVQPLEQTQTLSTNRTQKRTRINSVNSPRRDSPDHDSPLPDLAGRLQARGSGSSHGFGTGDSAGTTFYVRLGVLSERHCFGLHSLLYEHMPNVTLVSNGAECILISRQFLREHLDKTILHKLQLKVPPYPTRSQLQNALNEQLMWENYREKLVSDILK